MDTINNVELRDENIYPSEEILRNIFDTSYEAYTKLLELFDKNEMSHEWRYYKDGKAWLCKVQKKKKTIVWMSAWRGYVQATLYFQEKYLEKVYALDLSDETKNKIESTKNVGKSKPCIFEIRNTDIIEEFSKVMEVKMRI